MKVIVITTLCIFIVSLDKIQKNPQSSLVYLGLPLLPACILAGVNSRPTWLFADRDQKWLHFWCFNVENMIICQRPRSSAKMLSECWRNFDRLLNFSLVYIPSWTFLKKTKIILPFFPKNRFWRLLYPSLLLNYPSISRNSCASFLSELNNRQIRFSVSFTASKNPVPWLFWAIRAVPTRAVPACFS